MPSVLKARNGRPSFAEMKAQVERFWKPDAKRMEALFLKYKAECMASTPRLQQIEVIEPDVNWKALVMSLPKDQVSDVLGCGIRRIWLKETESVYDGVYRFHVERRDRTLRSFEWRDAYNDAYHAYKDKSFRHDVELALRAAVLHHIVDFKELLMKENQMELNSHISGVVLPWEKAVVQHYPTTFKMLVDAFLNEVNLTLEKVQLDYCDDHGYKIRDPVLLERWQTYHLMKANYRVISTDEAMLEVEQGL